MAMPQPGDLITAFSPQSGRCFRMVYSRQLQATHCHEPPAWKGIWKDRKGKKSLRGGVLNPFCGGANKSADSEATLRSMWSSVAAIHVDPAYFAILILVVVIALRIWRRRSRRGGGRGPFGRG